MYFYAKTVAEKAALEFAEKNGLNLVTVLPSVINGPFLTSTIPLTMVAALALMTSMFISQLYLLLTIT